MADEILWKIVRRRPLWLCHVGSVLACALALLVCNISAAQAQAGLLDGGFDQQAASVGQVCHFPNGSCPAGAWSGINHAGLLEQNGWDHEIAPSQTHFAYLQWDGVLQQTFTASTTGQYKIGWWAAGRGGGQGNEQYRVEIDGQNVGRYQSTSASAFIHLVSAPVSLVAGQRYALRFVGETNADQAVYLDSISLVSNAADSGLLDGGFDQQAASVDQVCHFPTGSCPAGAWSGINHAGLLEQNGWDHEIAPSQTHFAYLQWDGVLQQTFTARTTGQYKVSWWAAGRGGGQGAEQYRVEINGQYLGRYQSASSSAFLRLASAPISLVAGQSYTLRFIGETNADQAVYIDAVELDPLSAESTNYTYDALGRLIAVEKSDGYASVYEHDKAGNRKHVLVGGK